MALPMVLSTLAMHWRLPESLRGTPFEKRVTDSGAMDEAFFVDRPAMVGGVLQQLELANSLSYTVPLDHFDPKNPANISLRYWIVDSAWNKSSEAPLILYMPDEATGGSPENRAASLATKFGGVEVHTEHRFFGETLPEGGLSDENLMFLTVEQNLQDVAKLAKHVKKQLNLTGPVVATGCSYAGASACWLRTAHPDVIDASISGSGPIKAKLDFYEYDQSISRTLGALSPECQEQMSLTMKAFAELWEASNSSRDALKMSFLMISSVGTPMGDVDFLYMLADSVAYSVQYGDSKAVCAALDALSPNASTIERTSSWAHFVLSAYGTTWATSEWYDSEWMRDVTRAGSGRAWYWMTCSQLGYLQTVPHSEPPTRMRPRALTPELLKQQCEYIFPRASRLEKNIEEFNERYGGDKPQNKNASRVVFLTYADDPWRPLQPEVALSDSLPMLLADSNSSAGDTSAAKEMRSCAHCGAGCSVASLQKLNAGVADQLEAWFGEGSPPRGKNGLRKRLSAVASGLETDDGNNVLLPSHGNIVPQK